MTLHGWDASDYDWSRGPMDLAAAAKDGITFFTHKFTEGVTVRHTHAADATNRARAAGIPFIGGYHVVRTGPSAAAQVAYLLGYADAVVPWWRTFDGWFWQVDLELWSYDAVSADTGKAFAAALIAAQPKTVITYASHGQYGAGLTGFPTKLWNANYGANTAGHYLSLYPGDGSIRWGDYSGQTPAILQYGSTATIGSQTGCDANAFRGSRADFAAMIGGVRQMEQTDIIIGAASRGNTVGDVLADDENLRDEWYSPPSGHSKNPPPPGSRFDRLMRAADLILSGKVDDALATAAATLAEAKAATAAINALAAAIAAGGGSVDAAAIIAAVQQASRAESAAIAGLTAQLAAAQTREDALAARLAAALAGTG